MRGKKYRATKTATQEQPVTITEAVTFLKEHASTTFDETVEVHIHLGVNAGKSDQMVRGDVTFPAGSVKQPKVVVFTSDEKQAKAALAAGAAQAGGEELIAEIKSAGTLDADLTIANPALMPKIATVAKILGPKGLMPNPKTGTVTDNPAKALNEIKNGKVSFKMDQQGNIHQIVGKVSWDEEKITANTQALLATLKTLRPSAAKGEFFKSVTLKTTMSPAVRVNA